MMSPLFAYLGEAERKTSPFHGEACARHFARKFCRCADAGCFFIRLALGEEWETPVAEVDAAKHYGSEVARADAYPGVFHKDRGLAVRPPLAWELELMEGCLRAITDFVTRHSQGDPPSEEITVAVASGPLKLALSWMLPSGLPSYRAQDGGLGASFHTQTQSWDFSASKKPIHDRFGVRPAGSTSPMIPHAMATSMTAKSTYE